MAQSSPRANNPTKSDPKAGIPRKGGTPPARDTRPRASDAATGKKAPRAK